ncbi:SMEK domain-containing protein [Pseudomonas fluorescens]|uniref:SMEK domain-containing protein n=1 Tax=Pseudomonas fluorescens TaxID=294 RepID=A0A5E6X367_PSEFL|nr:SMEK domain-containing protein [Pseudomonas fluorescens]VVN36022.1 hypothetical protein PS652_05123 [Pseudomonas fluorescens]
MLTNRGRNLELITSSLSSYTHHINLQAQRNLLDEAKGAEDSLLDIVNLAYNYKFKNLNHIDENFPGIDWQEGSNGIGLQVTTTRTWKKITTTIDTLIRNKVPSAKEIWFLFISATRYTPKQNDYNGYTVKIIAIPDLLKTISSLEDVEISNLAKIVNLKLGAWIPQIHAVQASSYAYNSYSTPSKEPSVFISYHNLWDSLGDQTIVGKTILKQIEQFATHYSQLPLIARRVIAKTIQRATPPRWLNWKIEINLQELELYLSDDERSSFDNIITLLKSKDLGHLSEKNHKLMEYGEEPHITYDNYLALSWRMSEPDYDMFTALRSYYLAHFSEQQLFHAFEFSDFSEIC